MCRSCWMNIFIMLSSCMGFSGGMSLEAFSAFPTEQVLQDSSILEEGEPVDVVYTWVDGKDPAWKKSRTHWLKKTKSVLKKARKVKCFRNQDELKYSLRSIYAFAPFVRHIFIVTSGQRPKWLANHPKITVLHHKQFFQHKEHLPTFNSIAIEANLHHIPGLANHYIYFKNNFFLGQPVSRGDFFVRPYKIKAFLTNKKIFNSPFSFKSGMSITRNMAEFLERKVSRPGVEIHKNDLCYLAHTPNPMIKWIAGITEDRFSDIFTACSSHKFCSLKDMCLTNGLIPQYALHLGLAEACKPDLITVSFKGKKTADKVGLHALLKKRPMFFCIQNNAEKISKATEIYFKEFLEAYFPNPAPWERTLKRKHR